MRAHSSRALCIYCGGPVGRIRDGEHIVPKAIGGALTIERVCGACNNKLSILDTEFCSRSPVSLVASQEIDGHIWQAWDVDHAANNLLLEARPNWSIQSLVQYPQIVFDSAGAQIRGDHDEMLTFGREDYVRVLAKSAIQAFCRHKAGEKGWLHFERAEENPAFEGTYRLPPRIFARHSIRELGHRLLHGKHASFVLRYQTAVDRRRALSALESWGGNQRFDNLQVGLASTLPVFRCFYDCSRVLRALAKIAVNLLSNFCLKTPIDRVTLRHVLRVILGETPVPPRLFDHCGFVHPCDLESIKSDGCGHAFRMQHMNGHWHVYSSFFGNRVGSVVRFPGATHEDWRCADVLAPIGSKDWTVTTTSVIQPLSARVEWQDPAKIIPSVELCNVHSVLRSF